MGTPIAHHANQVTFFVRSHYHVILLLQMGQAGGYGQQTMTGMRDQGMPPGHAPQPGPAGMMMPNSMGGQPTQDQWGNPQPPPPMYNQSRPPMGKYSSFLCCI